MFGYVFFFAICLVYFVCFVCWVGALIYSLVTAKKRNTPWLTPVLVVIGIVGALPALFFMYNSYNTVSSVSGTYRESFNGGTTTLVLRPDGTFSQRYVMTSGSVFTNVGKWTLNTSNDPPNTVSFDKNIMSGGGASTPSGSSEADVSHSSLCFGSTGSAQSEGFRDSDCFTRL